MTMDDFEFGTPMEEMAAPHEGPPEENLGVAEPTEDGADVPIPQPPEAGAGHGGVEAEPPPEEPPKKKRASRKKTDKPEESPAEGHSSLMSLKLNELDRGLTEQERQEWNDIYASFRSKLVLTGRIIGVDGQAFNVRNRETGQVERRTMYCAVIIAYRVKVLIPETEMWMPGEERPVHVLRNMSGAEID